jgi:hypothetical protein
VGGAVREKWIAADGTDALGLLQKKNGLDKTGRTNTK